MYLSCEEYLWLPILLKSIMKILHSKDIRTLDEITPEQTYNLLTGLTIHKIPK